MLRRTQYTRDIIIYYLRTRHDDDARYVKIKTIFTIYIGTRAYVIGNAVIFTHYVVVILYIVMIGMRTVSAEVEKTKQTRFCCDKHDV